MSLAARAAAMALVLVACSYRPRLPPGALRCNDARDCPGAEQCVPIQNPEPLSVCCPPAGCGAGIVPLETADAQILADGPPRTPDAPPADGPPPADATSPPDLAASPPDAMVAPDAPSPSPDTAPPTPDGPAPCPANLPGPALVQAGGYCIDATEVSNAQYKPFVAAAADPTGGLQAECGLNADRTPDPYRNPWTQARVANRPVVGVDWCDAHAFCKWAGKSLCTRERWISACSGPSKTVYSYGDAYLRMACNVAVDNAENATDPLGLLWDVGSRNTCWGGYQPMRDMSGNVAEWTATCVKPTPSTPPSQDECWTMGGSIEDFQPSEYTCTYGYVDQADRLNRHVLRGFRCCWP
jgi:sulfatase modifying factor 1